MPLANAIPGQKVVVKGLLPDGTPYEDTYTLRGALGSYDTTNMLLAGMSMDDLKYFRKKKKGEGEENGHQADERPLSAGFIMAERDHLIIKTWLIGWSHDAPLTDENIREIPPDHMKVILKKIESIGRDAQSRPFPGGSGPEGDRGEHHPGEDNQQLDDVHSKGAGVAGAQLADDAAGTG